VDKKYKAKLGSAQITISQPTNMNISC